MAGGTSAPHEPDARLPRSRPEPLPLDPFDSDELWPPPDWMPAVTGDAVGKNVLHSAELEFSLVGITRAVELLGCGGEA